MGEQERAESRREAEQMALRNVRGALDEIQKQAEKERTFKRRILLCVLALLAGVPLLISWMRHIENKGRPTTYQVPEVQAIAVRDRVAHYIVVPAGVPPSAQVVVQMSICERGDLVGMGIAKSSGFPAFDDAVRKAASRFLVDLSACFAKPGSVEIGFKAG